MTGRHRPEPQPPRPPRYTWLVKPTGALAAILSVASLGILWHGTWEQAAPVTVAAPTAVDLREPTGHGGLGGPVAGPSFAPDVPVWTEDKGAVIVNGQALARPTVVAPQPVAAPTYKSPAPIYSSVPDAPTVVAATTGEPTPPTPIVVAPDVTEPDVTTPVETTPTETPAEPTVPVVEVTP